ncbi:hypothetical protein JYU34_019553 [Plutella xylostella]|uniref:Major facilitator superfamily (MFS) profile domain-containing protein n=1 Tax=Plutella xylostella TaxID=51655 RepID=A0ABQ7PYH3_PLUXY|nr:hypothetical protein JYU34_019553 [Plutella xylostella]
MVVLLNRFPPFIRQYIVVVTVNLSVFSLGISNSWASPVLPRLQGAGAAGVAGDAGGEVLAHPATDAQVSWILSVVFVSIFFGSFIIAYLQHQLGRKTCLLLGSAPRLIGYSVLLAGSEPWHLIVARLFVGLGDAFSFSVVPVYSSEVASKEIRGRLGTIMQLMTNLGAVFCLAAGPYLSYRMFNLLILIMVLVTTVPMLFLLDSPYYLFSKGRTNEAHKVLTFLRGEETLADKEILEYEQLKNKENKIVLSEVLRSKNVIKSLLIGSALGFLLHFQGTLVIGSYLQTILESAQTGIAPELSSVFFGLLQLVASIAGTVFSEKFRRKLIMTCSLLTLALGMICLGIFFRFLDSGYQVAGVLGVLPHLALFMILFGYNAGLGALIIPVIGELFEGPARAIGNACFLFSCTISCNLVIWLYPLMTSLVGRDGPYWVFATGALVFMVYILCFIPETRGKTFAEIQVEFGKDTSGGGKD